MASLKFRHYATESALKGTGTVQNALNAFDVGTIVFIDDTQKQYIITSKSNNVVTYKIYYGKAAVVGVSGTDAARILTFSDGSEIKVTINNVEHATSSDTANTAKSVAWNNVTNKPNLVTTDTEQIITGVKTFNNNTTFKNETDVESLTADSLLVTGSARFTNTINGNLKGNVEGNLTGNASTATTATTATEFSSNKTIALTGDITGSASSKGGWSVATTIANGAVTNAKLANSKITIAGTAVSLGGSIAASTIGAALTTSAPAAYATNAGNATKAAEATKATNDSDGNAINTTYLKKSGGTVSGALTLNGATTVNSTLTADNVTADNLTVNGVAKFNNGLEGNLKGNVDGNATTATTCTGNAGTATTLQNTRKINGTDFNGSADITTSKWGTARNITISDGTNSGTATSVDGSGAITLNLPGTIKANLSGNAATATKATNADRATGDSDGNAINTTYLKRSGGTVTGNVTFNSSVTADSITAEDLIVNGAGRFISGITGDLVGNVTGNVTGNLSGNASSATKATNDGSGNTITSTYATKTERANNDITAAGLTATKLTLTRAAGNITANIPTWNQDTTGTAAKATADAKGNNIVNTYATKAEVAALPKSMVIKGTLDATHALPTSGMTEGDTYIVGSSGTYNSIACKVGDFFVRTSDGWLRVPAGDEWEYDENTIKGIKVNNAGHADTAGTATSAGVATNATNSDKVDEFHAMSAGNLLYKYKVTASIPASSISGDFWYATITFSRSYSNELTKSLLSANYSNIAGQVYLNTYDFRGDWYAFTSNFNGSNIKGIAIKAQNNPIYYVKLAKPIMHNNNIQDGTITVYSPYNCTIAVSDTAPSGVTFTNLTIPGFTNLKASSAVNAGTATTALSCSGNADNATKDGSGNNIVNTYARIDKVYDDSSTYRQFLGKSGSSSDWVRTTEAGIIPYTNGDASHGHSSLGTSSWYFSKAYIQNIYGYLNGNISGSSASCSGNSATATKAGCLDTGTMTLYAHNSNEINFGGTSASSEIYVGYRATESRPIPTKFIFGGSGTAILTAGGFKKSDSNSSYVLTGDGGHAAISGLSVNYASSSGACTGNAATATKLQTARTIWGQSFDGSGNVSGKISNVGDILPATTHVSNLGSSSLVWERLYGRYIDTDSRYYLRLCAGGTEVVTITDPSVGSNVGIGTTSPTSKLHVAGNGYFTSDISSASNIIAGGYIKGETVKISSGCILQYDSTQKCVKFVFN